MALPVTPHKQGEAIEDFKRNLTAKWGLQFPFRDLLVSPSTRNPNIPAERVHNYIRFLFFQKGPTGGALDYALTQFEREAPPIMSKWQFKPRSDLGVITTRSATDSALDSALGRDFLHRRQELDHDLSAQLMLRLEYILGNVVDRVKGKEDFPMLDTALQSRPTRKKASSEDPPTRRPPAAKRQLSRQTSSSNYFGPDGRSTDPSIAALAAGQPSLDDYNDEDVNQIFGEHPMPDAKYELQGHQRALAGKAPEDSPDETFETPPTSPSRHAMQDLSTVDGSIIGAGNALFRVPSLPSPSNRKRPRAEPGEAVKPRKASRESSEHRSAADTSAAASSERSLLPTDGPKQLANAWSEWPHRSSLSRASSRSSELSSSALVSINSSFTSANSAITSPNTSFSIKSSNTSFGAEADDTDTTVRNIRGPTGPLSLRPTSVPLQTIESIPNDEQQAEHYADVVPMDVDADADGSELLFPNPTEAAAIIEPAVTKAETAFKKTRAGIYERLTSLPPFSAHPLVVNATVPFRQVYEVVRVATFSKIDLEKFDTFLNHTEVDDYPLLWKSLGAIVKVNGGSLPDRSPLYAWTAADSDYRGVSLGGKLVYSDSPTGPLFNLRLLPMKMEPTYRFSRKFGADRFFNVGFPGLGPESLPHYLKASAEPAREAILDWLVDSDHKIVGRTWKAFFARPGTRKKGQKTRTRVEESRFRIYFFAVDGMGFIQGPLTGETDHGKLVRPKMTVNELLEWFMPFKQNTNEMCLKFFARLSQGLSSTTPTVDFKPLEIVRTKDAYADCPGQRNLKKDSHAETEKRLGKKPTSKAAVMNDGCARISKSAAADVARILRLDYVPSVFQGRIGGAKGVWMVDTTDDSPFNRKRDQPRWIEITDSQLKFRGHPSDAMSTAEPLRMTLEVNSYSQPLAPNHLSYQLLPILQDRGVPADTFRWLLGKDLSAKIAELEAAMSDPLALRKWNQAHNPVTANRLRSGGHIEMQGGLPTSLAEKVNWFIDHGFSPHQNRYLKNQLYKLALDYCQRLESKMTISLPLSTFAYMIADPLNILAENEVHLAFSTSFKDPDSGFDQTMLHNTDLLVARRPAHLPSDIQKVRAVFKPELLAYRDVIVFPSNSSPSSPLGGAAISLAHKLSGGDYDGDEAWISWDPSLVAPFTNAPVPAFPPPKAYGIEQDRMKIADLVDLPNPTALFLRHALDFNLRSSMLGWCTRYHEALCYHTSDPSTAISAGGTSAGAAGPLSSGISSPQAINLAILLSHLVDSAKGGFIFSEPHWHSFLNQHGLRRRYPTPAYRDGGASTVPRQGDLIDDLVFKVAPRVREKGLGEFDKRFGGVGTWDEELARVKTGEVEEASITGGTREVEEVERVVKYVQGCVEEIYTYWKGWVRGGEGDEEESIITRPGGGTKKGGDAGGEGLSFAGVVQKCREDFMNIRPLPPGEGDEAASSSSPVVRRWMREQDEVEGGTGGGGGAAAAAGKGRGATYWPLLKASIAFHKHHRSGFVWYVAGVELGEIKALARGRGGYRVVVGGVYEALKLDGRVVDRLRDRKGGEEGGEDGGLFELGAGIVGGLGRKEEGYEGDFEDDGFGDDGFGDDGFGEWGWEEGF